jgi:transketolase
MNTIALIRKAVEIRRDVWKLIYHAKTGHTASDFSCADILVALYYEVMDQTPDNFADVNHRDSYIQSKGHAVEVLWSILADRGYFSKQELYNQYNCFNSHFIGHPNNHVNGIEFNTGSLGHGLSLGVGISLAAKMDKLSKRTFVLMGDGEQAEGSVWEAAMAAGNYHLNNLVGIIDHNKLQISGPTMNVMNSEPLDEKYQSFGWRVVNVNGNNMTALVKVLKQSTGDDRPTLILANTIKGKGIDFMENQPQWHHKVPNSQQYKAGLSQLDEQLEVLRK